MDGFRDYFEMSSLMDIIGDTPQRPDYHSEGPVGVHTRMVRGELENAIRVMQNIPKTPDSPFSNLDFNFSKVDRDILRVGAWLHDIGKPHATTVDGVPLKDAPKYDVYKNKITAIGHHLPQHFNPMARELLKSPLWRQIADSGDFEAKKDLWFIIRNHMEIDREGFSDKVNKRIVGPDGKYKNTRRVKLLLTLVLMDRMGRTGTGHAKFEGPEDYLQGLQTGAQRHADKLRRASEKQSEPAPNDPTMFLQAVGDNLRKSLMNRRQLSPAAQLDFLKTQLRQALRKKSEKEGLGLSDDSIDIYVNRYINS